MHSALVRKKLRGRGPVCVLLVKTAINSLPYIKKSVCPTSSSSTETLNFLRAQIQQRWKIFHFHVFAFPGCFLNTGSSQSIKISSNRVILSIDNGNHWKSMNWIPVSDWYYRLFTALTIYNGSPPLFFFFGMSQTVQLRKHIHELPNWSANMKMRNVETITHKFLSKTL